MLWQIVQVLTVATMDWIRRLLSDDKEFVDDGPPADDAALPEQPADVVIADQGADPELAHGAMRHDSLLFHSFLTSESALTPRADHGDLDSLGHGGPLVMLVRLGELATLQDIAGGDRRHGRDDGGWAVDSADFFVFVM